MKETDRGYVNRLQLSRRRFLALAGGALAAGILAGCGATTPEAAPADEGDAAPTASGDSAPDPTTAPPEAADVNLLYHFMTWSMPDEAEVAAVNEALNGILSDTIQATVTLDILDAGSYAEKMQLKDAGGEQYDLCYTSSWMNPYYPAVKNGSYVALDDLLPAQAPGLWTSMPSTTWEAARYLGHIYGVINQQIFALDVGYLVREDYADKYNLDVASIKTAEDLEPFLVDVLDGEGFAPIHKQGDPVSTVIFDTFGNAEGNWFASVDCESDSTEVFNRIAHDSFAKTLDLRAKWYDLGLYPLDPLNDDEADANVKSGKAAVVMPANIKPGIEVEAANKYGVPVVAGSIRKAFLSTGGLLGTLTAISRTTVSEEKAAQFLELINTDEVAYNTLCKGIEDRHWSWVDESRKLIEMIEGSGYNIGVDWEVGCQFNAYYMDEAQVGAWEAMKQANDAALPSPLLGFAYNSENVQDILPAVSEAGRHFAFPGGSEVIEDGLAAMEMAGVDEVIADAQDQVDAWLETRG